MTDLGTLDGYTDSFAYGINNAGQVVGISFDWGFEMVRPFLYNKGVMIDLNTLLPPDSGWVLRSTGGINESGQIIGYGLKDGAEHVYIMTPRKTKRP